MALKQQEVLAAAPSQALRWQERLLEPSTEMTFVGKEEVRALDVQPAELMFSCCCCWLWKELLLEWRTGTRPQFPFFHSLIFSHSYRSLGLCHDHVCWFRRGGVEVTHDSMWNWVKLYRCLVNVQGIFIEKCPAGLSGMPGYLLPASFLSTIFHILHLPMNSILSKNKHLIYSENLTRL